MSIDRLSPSNTDKSNVQAGAAEREANFRISAANKGIETAQLQVNESLNQIRDAYEKQASSQELRNESGLENQKLKGYEQIREMQRAQQAELRRLKQDGERELSKVQEHYRNASHSTERDTREHLKELQKQDNTQLEFTRKAYKSELEDGEAQHVHQVALSRQKSIEQIEKINNSSKNQIEQIRTSYQEAAERTQEKLADQLQKTYTNTEVSLSKIQQKSANQIREIREDTAYKLSAYNSRQSDPFYKLGNLNAHLRETEDAFILTAIIPEYEQNHVSASIKGNNLVITVNRKNEEELQLAPGHYLGSASFQALHESFPLSWPVDSSRLSKEFDGDEVLIHVPKKNEYAFKAPEPKLPERVRAEGPHFPENIRHSHPETHPGQPEVSDGFLNSIRTGEKEKGSGTLS